jgi:hypothetical protein
MTTPSLSVIFICPFTFTHVRKAVRHLKAQTIASSVELILVVSSPDSIADARADELEGFANIQIVPVGPIHSIDLAAVNGCNVATAPLIAYADDHAYLQPGWAEALVEASSQEWSVMVSLLENANPDTVWSWVNIICSYGWWSEGSPGGECSIVPGHNVTFRREVLFADGPLQPNALRRQSGLFDKLRARGARFALIADARSRHMNAATVSGTWLVRFNMGRYYGHTRALAENWSLPRRLAYVLGFPLIPFLRMIRLQAELPGSLAAAGAKTYPALFIGLVFDAIGQAAGYSLGPGDSLHTLETYEVHLRNYVTESEAVAMDI